ncbi:uncharacterized protein LOC106640534 [Copidosoma floridanum]|uniref:uncharacterized protein LOC106640534 n=1 Tax=Copidosoma floridanum TaxID=29053 RepID=UPI0006C9CDE3|nr:uncharacterized protein LOC106640534 [Copidosoma floridanum]
MLMVSGDSKAGPTGNFYFSPLRLRPVLGSAYLAAKSPRSVKESRLDLPLDVEPQRARHNGPKDVEDEAVYAKTDVDDSSGSETKPRKKKHGKTKKSKKSSSLDSTLLEHLCPKLRVSVVLSVLGAIVVVACCCALYLRRRIVACFKKCWPGSKKKKKAKHLLDAEEGGYPYQPSIFRKSGKKKNKAPARLIDTGTQDSRTSMAMAHSQPPLEKPKKVGCSPCCRKKNKKKKLRRT